MKVKVSYSPTLSEVNEVDLTIETTTRGEWLIGRSPDSDLVLDSPDISRVHAKFFVKAGNYYFSDLGSRNGSIFNGKQAEKDRPYSLSDGDIIRIADYVLILEAVAPAYEQPETVFRIIDPSLFSRPRSPENINANVANPAPEVVNEVPAPISQEVETPSPEVSEIPEVVANQSDEVILVVEVITPENIIQSPEAVVHDEIVDLPLVAPEIGADVEEVEVLVVNQASEVSSTVADAAIAPPENIIEIPEEEITLREATHYEVTDFQTALAVDLNTLFAAEAHEVEPSFAVDETISEASETSIAPDNIVAEVSSNQYIDLNNTTIEEASVNVDDVVPVIEVSELADIQSLKTTESEAPERISQTIKEVPEVEATQSDETPEETNVSEPPQEIIERNIVLIAHESKKSELAEFVSQHQEFFSQSFTITWPSVGEVLHQQAGITISQQTPAPISGGYQTIASLVGAGEILAVIFLRDLLQPQPGQANEEALLRLCTINQVLLATNLPTAEAIVHYLKQI
jgi:methylglyoxal synthase